MLSRFAAPYAKNILRRSTANVSTSTVVKTAAPFSRKSSKTSPATIIKTSSLAFGFAASTGFAFAGSEKENQSEQYHTKTPQHYRLAKDRDLIIENAEHIRLFSGRANPQLAQEIADALHLPLSPVKIGTYADGEIAIQVLENVRGKEVYIIQPTCPPGVNDSLMELLLLISTMRRASAQSITAILPAFSYARQDRKLASRVPISAADVARMLEAMGVDRVVAVDLHSGQLQGFFGPRTPCDNLEAQVVALDYFEQLGFTSDTTKVISPDAGGVYRAKTFRDGLAERGIDAGLAMIIKQRAKANQIERMDLVGEVEGCDVIIVDDMIDTAGTLCAAAKELKQHGAKRVYAFATHGVFSGPAYERIDASDLEKVVVCNTIPLREGQVRDKIEQLSVGKLLAQAIARIHSQSSVSSLFLLDKIEHK